MASLTSSVESASASETVNQWKRKYEALQAQTVIAQTQSKSLTSTQHSLGRGLRRMIDMFNSVRDLVAEADRRTALLDEGDEVVFTDDDDRLFRAHGELSDKLPSLKRLLDQQEDPELLELFYKNLRKGSDMARGDDAGNLKFVVVSWVDEMFGPSTPALRPNSKDERGLNGDHTGRLLCPGEYDWEDDDVRARIRQGDDSYPVTAQSWPLLLYAGNRCFADDVEKGLFKSSLLVKAFKFIFTSPTSAIEVSINSSTNGAPPPKRSKKSAGATRSHVASLIGMRRVTPRSIAYVALQLRFALASATAWNSIDGLFNYQEFYYACVDYFEIVPGPVAQARVTHLLEWWNRKVFGRSAGTLEVDNQRREGASVSILASQRMAREENGEEVDD